MQNSLFGANSEDTKIPTPVIPECDPWDELVRLRIEKDVVGLYLSGHPLDMYKIELETYCTATLDEVLGSDKYKGQEVKVGGIVSAVNVRKNAKGDDWAIVTLQDFNGTLEMMLFSKDYINFKAYLSVSNFLYIRGKVQSKWKDENQMELKPLQMLLLSEIREKNTKSIHINLDLKKVTNKTIESLTKTLTEHPGHCQVKVSLVDEEEKVAVEMASVTVKIAPENQLIAELERIVGLKYKLQ
jgi:DNA polymerase-3 subunit alpha